ncbi:MAG TPA: geranylgeranyl reductase family protein [Acidimicrobiales bacterium]|nr:geranylgeranyl reductase family protein [Acidimicrobiales bacterium]
MVVGGGPSGAACAYWLAEAGHDVLLVEKKRYPREKTCGDGLTPRAVKQLDDMGLADVLARHHRFGGLRSIAFGRTLELEWPDTPGLPRHGYVVTRHDLDAAVAERAAKAGAVLWQDSEAVEPVVEGGRVRGAVVRRRPAWPERSGRPAWPERSGRPQGKGGPETTAEVRARYVVVADGANSRFGRALGTTRNRDWPQGMAIRGYYTSPRHDEPWIESHLDVRDQAGNVLPGYGWIFPVGDGRVNVGVGLLSTFSHWKSVNTSKLMDAFVGWAPESWGIAPETACGPATGGRLPMGLSVGPATGPGWLVTGDAVAAINPFNGEGIAYAYETGRMAAEALQAALAGRRGPSAGAGGDGELASYDHRLQAEYALYFKVARAFVKIIGRPALMRALVGTGMHSRTLMEWVLRIMANMLRPDELGPAEAAYRAVAAIARLAPDRRSASALR